jgi:cytochrome b pre-mRNA-processing protein 3
VAADKGCKQMFGILWGHRAERQAAKALYAEIMRQSRDITFFRDLSVPDTLDGRFDLVLLHSFLVLNRIGLEKSKFPLLSQCLFDAIFHDTERAMREMGVGDLSVSKHMRRMMKAFRGRVMAYHAAVQRDNDSALTESLRRNLYGTVADVSEETLKNVTTYIRRTINDLKMQRDDTVQKGVISFGKVENVAEKRIHDAAGMVA